MVRYFEEKYIFQFPWDQVVGGFWQRYPNPFSKHVISEDVLSRQVNKTDQLLISKRFLCKSSLNAKLPKWASKYVGTISKVYVVEESICDLKNKIFTTLTRNATEQSYMVVEEKCVYQSDPTDSKKTICVKNAKLTSRLRGLGSALEQYACRKFRSQADKASQGLIYAIEKFKLSLSNKC
jgi:hypothetical protein